MSATLLAPEAIERFPCLGGSCAVIVGGAGPVGTASRAAAVARRRLRIWHRQLSRFDPRSELSRLNRDPRDTVPASPVMISFVEAAVSASATTGGLVDPTLAGELETAGYASDLAEPSFGLAEALQAAPARRAARPRQVARWRWVRVDRAAGTVTRPAGLRLDSGGIAKGLFGDLLAAALAGHPAFAIDAAGDVRIGGRASLAREVRVASPFEDEVLHTFILRGGAAATSGIGRRSWCDRAGQPCHHILDPATGRPAFTGVVQATALAPTGVQAEALAKAALLAGADLATSHLHHGGVVVYDDGGHEVVEPPTPKTR
ncbi:MAG: FAD:protein FMN transferase [Solirubrobacteraceae bacterium]